MILLTPTKIKFMPPPPPHSKYFSQIFNAPKLEGVHAIRIVSITKTASFWSLNLFYEVFFSEVPFCVCKSTILPCMEYCHHVDACSIWMCWISCRIGYVRLMLLDILPVLNPWLFMEIVP